LRKKITDAKAHGVITCEALPRDNPLGRLAKEHALSPPAIGYKYAAAHPAIATVLTGTTNIEHLEDNARAILGPPLPEQEIAHLPRVFSNVWEP
jgi:aryl-alcohol dehydrogenase-like predicted oxidoreductase